MRLCSCQESRVSRTNWPTVKKRHAKPPADAIAATRSARKRTRMRVGRVVRSRNALDPLGLDARRRAFCARMGRPIIAPIAPCPTERLQAHGTCSREPPDAAEGRVVAAPPGVTGAAQQREEAHGLLDTTEATATGGREAGRWRRRQSRCKRTRQDALQRHESRTIARCAACFLKTPGLARRAPPVIRSSPRTRAMLG